MSDPDDLLTTKEAAALLGMSAATLAQYRYIEKGPRYVKVRGHLVRYRRSDVAAYEAQMAECRSGGES